MKIALPVLTAFLFLAGCGGQTPAENSAQTLEEAAEQSTPVAANVLQNAATQIDAQNISDPAVVDQAMKAAGNAQAVQDRGLPPTQPAPGTRSPGNSQ